MTSKQESPTGSTEGEVLRQWDQRIHDAGDPLAALADLLSARQAARSRLFGLAGSTLLGCKLQRMLGAGGMGVTYAGIAADGSPVAVKLVAAVAQSSGERFEQECRVLQAMRHDAIVRYRDHAVLEDGTGVLVMDRIVGIELELLLSKSATPKQEDVENLSALSMLLREIDIEAHRRRRESVCESPRYRRRMLRMLAEIAEGLHAAHQQGVVHRDVKPANILVRDDLSPVLIDFGLARDLRNKASFTHSGVAMGTLAYMAPEQMGRDPGAVDRRADIYSLGLLLFRAMTGEELRQEVGEVIASGSRAFLLDGKRSRTLPVSVQAILYSCLDPRPERRYATASLLAEDLRAAAGDGVVRARRPGALSLALRDRRKLGAVAAATIGAFMLVGWHLWPRGRFVQFAATCDATDATVRIDGSEEAWLLDPVWLPIGSHTARLVSDRVADVETKFEVRPGDGVQWVGFSTHVDSSLSGIPPGTAPVLFTTGHAWLQMSPEVDRDARYIDGIRLAELSPSSPSACLPPGRHELRAVDGKGREEAQVIDMGFGATDVQLLPAWMSDIEGSYRRTWSTVLSPRSPDLEIETDAQTWLGPATHQVFGFGMRQTPCALVPSSTERPSHLRLRVNFGRGMRSAVLLARGERRSGGRLDVEVAFEGHAPQVWPLRPDGQLEPRVALRAERPADWLELRASFSSAADATSALALAKMFSGMHFGGHWKDEPPCFAVVADEGGRAQLPTVPSPSPLEKVPEWPGVTLPRDRTSHLGGMIARSGPAGAVEIWASMIHRGLRNVEVLEWPSLRLLRTVRADVVHPRKHHQDGDAFGFDMAAIGDVDGDGWQEMVLGDVSSQRLGPIESGTIARLSPREDGPLWLWPDKLSDSPFRDDCNGMVAACGDWNGDGFEDVLCGATAWWASPELPKSGRLCVVDGVTGRELKSIVGNRQFGGLRCCSTLDLGVGPHALLLRESWIGADQLKGDACSYSVWSGGIEGTRSDPLVVSVQSQAALVPSRTRPGVADLVICRAGPWQDRFSGFERYGVEGKSPQLLLRRELGIGLHDPNDPDPMQELIVADDFDGDGQRDLVATLFSNTADAGVLVFSAADLGCIARSSAPAGMVERHAARVFSAVWVPGGQGGGGGVLVNWSLGKDGSWVLLRPH